MSKENDLYNLFKRFAENKYTSQDLEWIRHELEDFYNEKDIERAIRHFWYHDVMSESSENPKHTGFDREQLLKKVHSRIQQGHGDFSGKTQRGTLKGILSRSLYIYYRAAAVLLIPLLGVVMMYFIQNDLSQKGQETQYSEIYAPQGSRVNMELPDGSNVWLNHGSRLKYPQNFEKKHREVTLTGEAYFEVEANHKRPFIVNTSKVAVRVTGTSFNVMAYDDEEKVGVSLDAGSLEVLKSGAEPGGSTSQIRKMEPGEHLNFHKKTSRVDVYRGRNEVYTAWRHGKIIFQDEALKDMVKKLERRYNMQIELKDEQLADYTFTATFSDETLTQILNLLCKAAPLKYEMKERTKMKDNSFSTGKVIIKKE